MKIIRVLAGTFFALLLLAAPAAAQQYPISTTTTAQQGQTVSDSELTPGEPFTVSGGGFRPATTVTVTFDTQVLGTTQTRADGTFSLQVTTPANASPGSHTIASTGTGADGATRRLTSTVQVLGATAARAGTLPRTGTGLTTPLAASAALLIGAGAVAVVATRRRRA